MSVFDLFLGSTPTPSTYEEAYDLSYKLLPNFPKKAIKVIRSIHKQDTPVEESDIFYVNAIAALAARPIYRETAITKTLLQKVIAVKHDNYVSNALLFSIAVSEKDYVGAKSYGNAMLNSDYRKHLEELLPTVSSAIAEIRDSAAGVADSFHAAGNFFAEMNDHTQAMKAYEIAVAIDPLFFEAHHNIGIMLYKLERYLEAIESFKADIVLVHSKAEQYSNHRNVESVLNNFLSRIYFNIGKSYFRLNKLPECRQYLQESVILTEEVNNTSDAIEELISVIEQDSDL